MISKELIKKIKYIQISTRKTVTNFLGGEYESAFKGNGIEFEDVREYQPGDDVRSIDWNVTARTGKPFIKRFVEERELTVFFAVDLSASGSYGSGEKSKNEIAAEICALLAFSAIKNNDKIGLLIFTDEIELFVPPKKGMTHGLRLLRELLFFKPESKGTNIEKGLDYLGRVLRKKAVVFLVSDFFDTGYEKKMRIMSRRHDLIAVTVTDPHETELPDIGLIEISDTETGKQIIVDTGSKSVRKDYKALMLAGRKNINQFLISSGIDKIDIHVDQDYVKEIIRFFLRREHRQAV